MTTAQGRRSHKLKGYYTRQFAVTIRNKARRAKKRALHASLGQNTACTI